MASNGSNPQSLIRKISIWTCRFAFCAGTLVAGHANADDGLFDTPFGIGVLAGRVRDAENTQQYALAIEGQNHFKQRRGRFGFRQYGHAESRMELGNGLGFRLSSNSGFTVYGLPPAGGVFSPHLGIEPLAGRIAVNTNGAFERAYEWMPMVSVGLQWGMSHACRLLPLLRAGGAAGNLGSSGWAPVIRPAYGLGAYVNCERLDGAFEISRLLGGDQDLNLATFDAVYALHPEGGLKIGLRAESDLGRGGSAENLTEQRVLLLLRGELTH